MQCCPGCQRNAWQQQQQLQQHKNSCHRSRLNCQPISRAPSPSLCSKLVAMEVSAKGNLRRSFGKGRAHLNQDVSDLSRPPAQELLRPHPRVPFGPQRGASCAEGSAAARASLCRRGAPGASCIAGGRPECGATCGIAALGLLLLHRRLWRRRRRRRISWERRRRLWSGPSWRRSRCRWRRRCRVVRACWIAA